MAVEKFPHMSLLVQKKYYNSVKFFNDFTAKRRQLNIRNKDVEGVEYAG